VTASLPPPASYEAAKSYLLGLDARGIKLDLERMRASLAALGSPERSFPAILVAGTNGKGSTSAMLASVLAAGGRRVGLFTSPHLLDLRERIRVDGRLLSPQQVTERVEQDREVWERHELSFFEAMTALGLSAFRAAQVDVAVLEVGLGGRLDATNTVEPTLSIITSLGMDHAELLGDTPAAIAREKAGILRTGVPAVAAGGPPQAVAAVRARAAELGAPFLLRRACLSVRRAAGETTPATERWEIRRRDGAPPLVALSENPLRVSVPLAGFHQGVNAATAVLALAALRGLGWKISTDEITAGIARVRWPGRLERPLAELPLIADVAHNREGAEAIARVLAPIARRREIRPVVGMVGGKDHAGFFHALRRIATRVWIASPATARAATVDELRAAALRAGLEVAVHPSIAAALRDALRGASDPVGPLVLLAGSFFTLEEGYRALDLGPRESLWEASS